MLPAVPSRENATAEAYCPKRIYRHRHRIENIYSRSKDRRRVANKYDKLARNLLAVVYLAAASMGQVMSSGPR